MLTELMPIYRHYTITFPYLVDAVFKFLKFFPHIDDDYQRIL